MRSFFTPEGEVRTGDLVNTDQGAVQKEDGEEGQAGKEGKEMEEKEGEKEQEKEGQMEEGDDQVCIMLKTKFHELSCVSLYTIVFFKIFKDFDLKS